MEQLISIPAFNKMIWSIDWINNEAPLVSSSLQEDIFEASTYENTIDEFGINENVFHSKDDGLEALAKLTFNENFDFQEECASLKQEMINYESGQSHKETTSDKMETNEPIDTNPTLEQCQENVEMLNSSRSPNVGSSDEAEQGDEDLKASVSDETDMSYEEEGNGVRLLVASTEHSFSIWDLGGKLFERLNFEKKPGFNCKYFLRFSFFQ